jgi:hypothetical protein
LIYADHHFAADSSHLNWQYLGDVVGRSIHNIYPPLGIYPKIDGYPLSTLQSPGNISNQPALPQETLLFSQRNATNEEFDGTAGSPSRGSREAFLLCCGFGQVLSWLGFGWLDGT